MPATTAQDSENLPAPGGRTDPLQLVELAPDNLLELMHALPVGFRIVTLEGVARRRGFEIHVDHRLSTDTAAEVGPLYAIETSADLVIHARRVHEAVVADPRRFHPVAEALVRQARLAGDPEALVLALRALAWAERARLADVEAKRHLDESAAIARRHRLSHALADALISRAAVNQELGRLAAAQRDLDTASRLADPQQWIELTFQQAVLHQNIGRLGLAASAYRELLAHGHVPQHTRVLAGNNLALIEAQRGRHAEALRCLDDVEEPAAKVGPALVAMVVESRAWVTVHAGRLTEGLALFDEAARAHEAANLPLGEHYVEYADALMDLRLLPEASLAARTAAEAFQLNGVPLMGAEAQLRVAQLAMLSGDLTEAVTASTLAAESFQRQGRGMWKARAVLVRAEARLLAGNATPVDLREARRMSRMLESRGTWSTAVHAYVVAGRIAATLGRTKEAVEALQRAAGLARNNPVLVRLRGAVAAALAARILHQDDEVLAHCRRGLGDLARHRDALPSLELRALASGHGAELGQFGLEVVVRDGRPQRVLEWMERTRAAALLVVEPPTKATLADDLEALRTAYTELKVAGDHASQPRSIPRSLLTRQLAIENRIRKTTWHSPAKGTRVAATISPARLRELLAGRVLIEYGILGDGLIAVVVEPKRSRIVTLGATGAVQDQTRALFFALRRLAQQLPEPSWQAARQSADLRIATLRKLLIQPVHVPPQTELVVVPVGHLHGIPWSALHDGPLSVAPSAGFWARSCEAAHERRDNATLVLVEGPHLPGATIEVRRLGERFPHATAITPPDSTAHTVLSLLNGADLVHLACHGILRADNPMFSSLLLSDGPLSIQELVAYGVAPRRLILASCQSGADVSYAGDEVLGFVSTLLARGTAGLVASVAAIPDVAAVDLMCGLHDELAKGNTLARALYEARQSMDRDAPGAYLNWCTFSAHGAA